MSGDSQTLHPPGPSGHIPKWPRTRERVLRAAFRTIVREGRRSDGRIQNGRAPIGCVPDGRVAGAGDGYERGMRTSLAGLLVNAALAIVKLTAGLVGHSYALVADAVESTSDVLASLIVWRGLRIAAQPADEEHPYGHGRAEPLAAMVVALMLVVAGIGIAIEAVQGILTRHAVPAPFTLYVLLGVVVSRRPCFVSSAASDATRSRAVATDACLSRRCDHVGAGGGGYQHCSNRRPQVCPGGRHRGPGRQRGDSVQCVPAADAAARAMDVVPTETVRGRGWPSWSRTWRASRKFWHARSDCATFDIRRGRSGNVGTSRTKSRAVRMPSGWQCRRSKTSWCISNLTTPSTRGSRGTIGELTTGRAIAGSSADRRRRRSVALTNAAFVQQPQHRFRSRPLRPDHRRRGMRLPASPIGERTAGLGHDGQQGGVVPDLHNWIHDDVDALGRQAGVAVGVRPAAIRETCGLQPGQSRGRAALLEKLGAGDGQACRGEVAHIRHPRPPAVAPAAQPARRIERFVQGGEVHDAGQHLAAPLEAHQHAVERDAAEE